MGSGVPLRTISLAVEAGSPPGTRSSPPQASAGRAVADDFLDEPLIQRSGRTPFRVRADRVHRRAPDVLVREHRLARVARSRGAGCGHLLMLFRR